MRSITTARKRARGLPSLAVLVLAVLACPTAALAVKTDLIVLKNGDKITGDVKGMSRGKLDYSTDDAGRLSVEWVKVTQVTSPKSFEVQVASGAKYYGRLVPTGSDGMMAVQGATTDTLRIPAVVEISRLDAGFMQRVKAYLDLGLTFAKANQATTFSSSGEAAYRGDRYGSTISFDSYAQGQESAPTTTRTSVGLRATRFLPDRWSVIALGGTEQNDELNLDLRLTGAGLLGRRLVQSNSSELGVGVGLAISRERFFPSEEDSGAGTISNNNLEGLIAVQWEAFRYDSPKLDFSTSMRLFPSISSAGRVRGEFTLRIKYELFSDFDVGINGTDTFDSDPPEASATHNDYITTFTIGWSYRR